jgi:hypothetical protein
LDLSTSKRQCCSDMKKQSIKYFNLITLTYS